MKAMGNCKCAKLSSLNYAKRAENTWCLNQSGSQQDTDSTTQRGIEETLMKTLLAKVWEESS